jgi:hypothetical protein
VLVPLLLKPIHWAAIGAGPLGAARFVSNPVAVIVLP